MMMAGLATMILAGGEDWSEGGARVEV